MDETLEIFSFLKKNPLFEGLDDEKLHLIIKKLEEKHYKPNEIIFEEFEEPSYLCLLYTGQAEIVKWDNEKKNQFKIKSLQAGELFGEMAFIDEQKRSATVKATTACTVFMLKKELFKDLNPQMSSIFDRILTNITKIAIPRLRTTDEAFVQSLQTQMRQLQLSNQFGHFFIVVILIFGIGNIFDALLQKHFVTESAVFNWSYLITLLLPFLVIIKLFHFSLKDGGVTLKNWKKSLFEGLVISAVSVFLYFFGVGPVLELIFKRFGGLVENPHPIELSTLFLYLPSAYIQEFIARGVIQTVLQRFYNDAAGLKSVFITSLLFSIFHLHIGFGAAIIVFIFSFVFGLIYIRHYNLIGVSIVHFTIGTIAQALGILG